MKIFITGIAGFLGSHLANRMINLNHEVSGNDNLIGGEKINLNKKINFFETDCNDLEGMSKIIKGNDIVYHCAATAHEGLSVFSPNIITKNIFQASVSTITASIQNNVKRFIYCSSMARYGNQKTPFDENMDPKPEDPYGIAKVAGENILKVLADLNGMEWNIAVPHNIVGPNQKYDDPFRNVLSIFINRNLQNKPAIIYGDGNQKRCFSYIDDVIYCLEKLALDKKINKEIINIGPDEEEVTINEIAEMVANKTGFNGKPIYVSDRPKEVKFATCNANKSRKLLNYQTKTSLKEAIIKTSKFIKDNGVKEFKYYLPVEIINKKTPETWMKKLI
jgi:UDP-glucose 4-epimerase|tara:strand:- start:2544 stop:3545 length:1002 start_codon:yes stop_codon:yes gene_type:complete